MQKSFVVLLFVVGVMCVGERSYAKVGDTTHVPVLDKYLWTGYGSITNWAAFPPSGKHYEKVLLRYRLTCPSPSCGQWDYTTQVFLRHHTGVIDSTLKDAPNFTVNGNTVDSFAFRHDTTRTYSYNSSKKRTDSSANAQVKIYFYRNPAAAFTPTDSEFVWAAGYWNYRFDSTGKKTDSLFVKGDSTLHVVKVKAYFKFEVVVPYEIGRLITPYGQGFPKGWTFLWTMDVTDYAFLLHDSCELVSSYSGYSQGSLYTLSFDFIEGTPAREAYRIDVLSDGYFPYGDVNNPIANYLPTEHVWFDPNADVLTWRTFTTGHGNAGPDAAAEFLDNTETIFVNDSPAYPLHFWRTDCGANPVYPQTGTWTLSRAGWCPGDKVDPWDFDLTALGKHGDSVAVRYAFADYSISGGGYAIHNQAIYSKGPQYSNDVALMSIEAPTGEPTYRRTNPICSDMSPIVTIRNNGKNDLTSLTIRYGIDSAATANTFSWKGTLKYYETAIVALPGFDLGTGTHTFNVSLDAPNGVTDEYTNNNTGSAVYSMPNLYSNNVYLTLKTDFLDGESNAIRYEVVDASDHVLYSQGDMPDATIVRDTFKLATGCYRFRIFDESSYPEGLYPWLLQRGDPKVTFGYFTLKDDKKATVWNATPGNNLASFGPEEIVPFMVQAPSSVPQTQTSFNAPLDFTIYPNPAHGKITLDLSALGSFGGQMRVSVVSMLGKEIIVRTIGAEDLPRLELDMQHYPAGNYIVRLEYGDRKVSKRCVME